MSKQQFNWLKPIFIFTAFVLSACFGGGTTDPLAGLTQGDLAPLQVNTEAILVCSQACGEAAQCGTSTDRGDVVLLSTFGASTEAHNIAHPAGSTVSILQSQPETMRRMLTGEQFLLTYYKVSIADRAQEAWVPGWCIAGTPATTAN